MDKIKRGRVDSEQIKFNYAAEKRGALQSFENALWFVSFPLIYGSGQLL